MQVWGPKTSVPYRLRSLRGPIAGARPAAPNTFLPERVNSVSSTATVIGGPAGSNLLVIMIALVRPVLATNLG